MKNLILLMVIACSAFLSCDGRYHNHKSNAEILKEQHLYASFSKQLEIIPEKPVVIETDTLLSNGFELHLKFRSLEKNYRSRIVGSNPKKEFVYKNFGSDLVFKKGGRIILKQRITKSLFKKFESQDYWNKAIMQYVWIDYEASLNDRVYLNTSFYVPETNSYKDFTVIINEDGHMHIERNSFVSKIL